MIVLGIDPGSATTGYGVVARASDGAVSLLECGVIRTEPGQGLALRLRQIYEGVSEVLARHAVDELAVEMEQEALKLIEILRGKREKT